MTPRKVAPVMALGVLAVIGGFLFRRRIVQSRKPRLLTMLGR
jgi:hypothetical protein